jgi:formylglycine-generating enzyme required for sulfatase activity
MVKKLLIIFLVLAFGTTSTFATVGFRTKSLVSEKVENMSFSEFDVADASVEGGSALPSPDFNGNGTVDFPDFLMFAVGFGKRSGETGFDAVLDLDQSGDVGFADFLTFAQSFGKSVADLGTQPSGGGTEPPPVTEPEKELRADLLGGASMDFVKVEAGTFTMGSPSSEVGRRSHEGPQHEVTISNGFYLGKYEVTQGQWEAVMGTSPWSGQNYVQSNVDNPAVYVSWNDAQAFVQKLNVAAGDSLYRLPSEGEWEYACRAGTTTRWSFGEDESKLKDYAWYTDNAWDVGEEYAHKVGTKLSNGWGLYDMHGNVYEWCVDRYGSYSSSSQTDPQGSSSGSERVVRGGGFDSAWFVRSAYRDSYSVAVGASEPYLGFRLLRISSP